MTIKKKIIIIISLCLAGSVMLAACKVSGSVTTDATDGTIITVESSVVETTKEPTETAAVRTPTPTPAMLEEVVMLPIPATYASLFDGTKIYSDGSRTVILKTLVKGDLVTITGTSGQYGVTAEGSYINLHLMSVVVTVTHTPAETTAAPTDPTAATTKAPETTTKAPAATTAAQPVETTATPVATTTAPTTDYTAICADIRSKLIAILEANGQWDEAFTGESTKSGSQWWGVGFYDDGEMSTDDFAQHFYANKFNGRAICGTSISCYMADGNINIAYTAYWTS